MKWGSQLFWETYSKGDCTVAGILLAIAREVPNGRALSLCSLTPIEANYSAQVDSSQIGFEQVGL